MHNLKSTTIVDERFEIIERLGAGGMGVVYKARQISLDRIVALKVLLPHLLEDANALARFQLEAHALASMKHRHIGRFYAYGVWHGRAPYIAMEFLDEQDLAAVLLDENNRLTWRRTLSIAEQIAEGMSHAHHAGIIHRDLKPSNVFVLRGDGEELVKVADFGLAKLIHEGDPGRQKLTRTGLAVGSPHYMSPEQIRGLAATASCDIYALGCLMYQCLFGRPPYAASSMHELLKAHIEKKSPVPSPDEAADVPAQVLDILRVALAKDQSDRYQSMDQFAQAIREALSATSRLRDSKSRYVPPSAGDVPRQPHRRRRAVFLAIAVLLCFVILSAVAFRGQPFHVLAAYAPIQTSRDPVQKIRAAIDRSNALKRAGDVEAYQMVLSSIAADIVPTIDSAEYKALSRKRQREFSVSCAVALNGWRPAQTKEARVVSIVPTRMADLGNYDEQTLWDSLWVRFDRHLESQHMAFWETCLYAVYEVLREGKTSQHRQYNLDWIQQALDHPMAKTPAECAVLSSEVGALSKEKHPELAADPLIALCINYCVADQSDVSAITLRNATFAFQPIIEDRDGNALCYLSYKMLFEWMRARPHDEQIVFLKHALLNEDTRSYWDAADIEFRRRCEAALAHVFIESGKPEAALKVYEHGLYAVTHQLADSYQFATGPYREDTQLKIAELQMKTGHEAAAYATFKRIYRSSKRGAASRFARYGMLTIKPNEFKQEWLLRKTKPSLDWLSREEPRLNAKYPKDPLQRARIRLTYADALFTSGKIELAREQYEKGLDDVAQIPDEPAHGGWQATMNQRLAGLAVATGNLSEAERRYSNAEDSLAASTPEYWNIIAARQLAKGDVEAAQKALWHAERYQLGLCEEAECAYLYWKARAEAAAGRRSVALDLARESAREWQICCLIDSTNWVSPTFADTLKLVRELSQ